MDVLSFGEIEQFESLTYKTGGGFNLRYVKTGVGFLERLKTGYKKRGVGFDAVYNIGGWVF